MRQLSRNGPQSSRGWSRARANPCAAPARAVTPSRYWPCQVQNQPSHLPQSTYRLLGRGGTVWINVLETSSDQQFIQSSWDGLRLGIGKSIAEPEVRETLRQGVVRQSRRKARPICLSRPLSWGLARLCGSVSYDSAPSGHSGSSKWTLFLVILIRRGRTVSSGDAADPCLNGAGRTFGKAKTYIK